MDNIQFKIVKNVLTISLYKREASEKVLNKTDIIDSKEVVFSIPYILTNGELVVSFLNLVILKNGVKKAAVKDFEFVNLVLKILNFIPHINELTIVPDRQITYSTFMLLLENKTLSTLNVYDIPHYLLERLDINKDLKINIRSEILFISNFMGENKLESYSDIYYAKSISIYSEFSKEDKEDFNTFLNINHHLKSIYISYFKPDILNYVLKVLKDEKKQHLKIIIQEKGNDLNEIYKTVNLNKKKNEKYYKQNQITFKMDFSPEYKRENLFKQINLNFIKGCILSVVFLNLFLIGLNQYANYVQAKDIESIENDIKDLIDMVDREFTHEQDPDIEIITPDNDTTSTTTTKANGPWLYHGGFYRSYSAIFERLLEMNENTVGWLTVNGTRIDYPVVQSDNNEYYLGRDFNQKRNSLGWVFMDFRNNVENLYHNTIIYAHYTGSGVMFGSLVNVLNQSWQNKESNHIITFNTLYAEMNWRVFSIYQIPDTSDYLITNFLNKNEHAQWLEMISTRSFRDFGVEVGTDDKILTLSTCQNRGRDRLVVHAVLINDEAPANDPVIE